MAKVKENKLTEAAKVLERAGKRCATCKYVLKLYITGMTPRSIRAITNLKQICEEHLSGRYEIEVIDIYQQPVLARGEQIIAAPTLIKKLPEPLRRFIGDMSDTQRVLLGLDLRPKAEKKKKPLKKVEK